jgi:hypothetical protein
MIRQVVARSTIHHPASTIQAADELAKIGAVVASRAYVRCQYLSAFFVLWNEPQVPLARQYFNVGRTVSITMASQANPLDVTAPQRQLSPSRSVIHPDPRRKGVLRR